jgi:NAD(P)-dependent dehydrogenase (short-subunit alcohol dehydrogenase family)
VAELEFDDDGGGAEEGGVRRGASQVGDGDEDAVAANEARLTKRLAFEERLAALQLLRSGDEDAGNNDGTDYDDDDDDDGDGPRPGSVQIWPVDLNAFQSVRDFGARYLGTEHGLDVLIHAAATKGEQDGGCALTADGFERQLQTNYLSPFLLSRLLMPALAKHGGRIVHVVCQAGLQVPDYLPWPLRRTHPSDLPTVHTYMDEQAQSLKRRSRKHHRGECSPLEEYANSKLALAVHSHYLARRLNKSPKTNMVTSVAVDPGALDNDFGRSASKPKPAKSMRAKVFGYFPPVWIFRKIFGLFYHTFDLAGFGLRAPATGAKAVFHVATAAKGVASGALYSDASGTPFVGCQESRPSDCGRLGLEKLPDDARDRKLARKLYKWTMKATAKGRKKRETAAARRVGGVAEGGDDADGEQGEEQPQQED